MDFRQKLDLLMTITHTTNRELGQYLVLDPSQVSRVRNGRRKPAGVFLEPEKLATFFAGKMTQEYQRDVVEKALDLTVSLPRDPEEMSLVLTGIFRDLADPTGLADLDPVPSERVNGHRAVKDPALQVPVEVYYGLDGNEKAKVTFLSAIAAERTPRSVCLFNNDDMVWMKEDSGVSLKINDLSRQLLARGHRIKTIFSGDRNLVQMKALVDVWLSRLLDRSVEVFYYPGQVDGLFRRHISVVNGVLALTSSSVGEMNSDKMTLILQDKNMIRALQKEFDQLLYLSKPLFSIYRADNEKQMLEDITHISKEETPTFRYADPLPVNTMPESVFASIYERMKYRNKEDVARHYRDIYRFNEWNLQRVPILEMIRLPPVADVRAGRIPVEQSLYFPMDTVYYTPAEYAAQLRHIIHLLARHENYRLHLTTETGPENHLLLIKKDMHVLATGKRYPPMIMTTREPIIVDIFWNHYMEKTGLENYTAMQKQRVMRTLEQYLDQIDSGG